MRFCNKEHSISFVINYLSTNNILCYNKNGNIKINTEKQVKTRWRFAFVRRNYIRFYRELYGEGIRH